jgi:methylated-DNA-[protein]-cysteine S-methyltransferase
MLLNTCGRLPQQIFQNPGVLMRNVLTLLIDRIETPIGELLLVADAAGNLRAIDWAEFVLRMQRFMRLHYGKDGFRFQTARNPHGLRDKMERYFAGDVGAIDDIPVQTAGTPFQRSVWSELRKIPGGSPISYGKLAEQIARPKAVRAVGLANGSNPIGIVVPCHRVIGSDGSLTGYGGGLERKRWLLDHEQKHVLAQSKTRDTVRHLTNSITRQSSLNFSQP